MKENLVRVNITLPQSIYTAMTAIIPKRKRSQLIAQLLEQELTKREKKLYSIAKELDKDTVLNEEIAEWNVTLSDGLDQD